MEYGLDVQPGDVYWNAADPSWAYGLYYAIVGPLAAAMRSILLHAGFSPALIWQVLQRCGTATTSPPVTGCGGLPRLASRSLPTSSHGPGPHSAPKHAITTAGPSTAC